MGFLSTFSFSNRRATVMLLLLFILICRALPLQIKGEGEGSVLFMDNPNHLFFRPESNSQEAYMTKSDVAATISVLLGFAPSGLHSFMSSSELDTLLIPNPFDRPHAVFMMEANGISQELLSAVDFSKVGLKSYSYRQLVAEPTQTSIELPEDEVMFNSLNEASDNECDTHCMERDLLDLAFWLGGSYTAGQQPLQGNLSIPLSESLMILNLLEKTDQSYVKELVSLHRNIRRVASMHKERVGSSQDTSYLLMGSFAGVEALQKHYSEGIIPRQGLELFLNAVVKLFHSLQISYRGQIVGVIAINSNSVYAPEGMFDVKLAIRNSRWLSELGPSKTSSMSSSTTAEIKLVRKAVAWSTAVILLIATLSGVLYLFNMPLTRDTLLYSSVKLD